MWCGPLEQGGRGLGAEGGRRAADGAGGREQELLQPGAQLREALPQRLERVGLVIELELGLGGVDVRLERRSAGGTRCAADALEGGMCCRVDANTRRYLVRRARHDRRHCIADEGGESTNAVCGGSRNHGLSSQHMRASRWSWAVRRCQRSGWSLTGDAGGGTPWRG